MSRDAGAPDFPFRYYGHSEWLRQGAAAKVEPLDEILASEGIDDPFDDDPFDRMASEFCGLCGTRHHPDEPCQEDEPYTTTVWFLVTADGVVPFLSDVDAYAAATPYRQRCLMSTITSLDVNTSELKELFDV